MESFWGKKKISLYSVYSQDIKASVCERAIRTLKHKTYRYLTALESLSALNSLVLAHNNTPHRGLMGKTPSPVHTLPDPNDWRKKFRLMYKKHAQQKSILSSKLEVGDLVRIVSLDRSKRFATGYTIRNTEEIFRIYKINYSILGNPTYKLENW